MTIPATLGIDPGSGGGQNSGTGIVAVDQGRVVAAVRLRRQRSMTPVTGWVSHTHTEKRQGRKVKVTSWYEQVWDFGDRLQECLRDLGTVPTADGEPWTLAVEGWRAPTGWRAGRKSLIDPWAKEDLTYLVGVVRGTWRNTIVVPPGGHGRQHRGTVAKARDLYPPEIVGGNSVPFGTWDQGGPCVHLYSAWDICWAAHGRTAPAPDRSRR